MEGNVRRTAFWVASALLGCAHPVRGTIGSGSSTTGVGGATSAIAASSTGSLGPPDPAPADPDPSFYPNGPDPTVSVSPQSNAETESSILYAPTTLPVVVTWKAEPVVGPSFVGYALSTDGLTFGGPQVLPTPTGEAAREPTLGWTGFTVDIAWLAFDSNGGTDANTHIYAADLAPGASAFGAPTEVTNPADLGTTYSSPRQLLGAGPAIITYAYRNQGDSGIVASSRLADGTWQRKVLAHSDPAQATLELPTGTWDGTVSSFNIAYIVRQAASNALAVHLLHGDGIGGWQDSVVSLPNEPVASVTPGVITPGITANAPGSTEHVWVSYGLATNSGNPQPAATLSDIRLAESEDGGVTFPIRKSAQATNVGPVSASPSFTSGLGGAMDLVYYAGAGEGDAAASLAWARDYGFSGFLAMPKVAAAPVVFEQNPSASSWLGDMIGVSSSPFRLYVSYVDNTSGASHIRVHRVRTI